MRKPIIAGNWKLNKNIDESIRLVTEIRKEVIDTVGVDIVLCPTFIALSEVKELLLDTDIGLGAQNIHWEDSGAFTGEISAPIIKQLGAQYVILGHSERRQFFGETDETVNKKIRAALNSNLTPIVCVGENLEERECDKTFDVIKGQCEKSLANFLTGELGQMVIAYEPIWAIGTGKTATPEQAQEVHKFIRGLLVQLGDEAVANSIRLQYGGSVKPGNIVELINQPDIDGALVGGASLEVDSFVQIVKNSISVKA